MLDPWIIEQIRRREDERRRDQEGGRLEIPVESPRYREKEVEQTPSDDDAKRGVVVIDL